MQDLHWTIYFRINNDTKTHGMFLCTESQECWEHDVRPGSKSKRSVLEYRDIGVKGHCCWLLLWGSVKIFVTSIRFYILPSVDCGSLSDYLCHQPQWRAHGAQTSSHTFPFDFQWRQCLLVRSLGDRGFFVLWNSFLLGFNWVICSHLWNPHSLASLGMEECLWILSCLLNPRCCFIQRRLRALLYFSELPEQAKL